PNQPLSGPQPDVLQPGNSVLREFTLRTRQRNFFTPSVYCLHVQIVYEMDGKTNHDTVKTNLNIKAPISALIWGAVPGAVAGTLLRQFTDGKLVFDGSWAAKDSVQLLVKIFASVLIALVLVVAFARKKDAQPFISVEDFY